MPIREDVYSRRILRDLVHLVVQKEVSTLTPRFDLSPRTRVYVRGGRWVSNRSGFWPVGSGTALRIPIYQKIFGSFLADEVDILLGTPIWYRGASAICLDLPSVESLKRFGRSSLYSH